MELYNVTVQSDAKDCDGFIDYKDRKYEKVSQDEMINVIGWELFKHGQSSSRVTSEGSFIFEFYLKTDEGFTRSEVIITEVNNETST